MSRAFQERTWRGVAERAGRPRGWPGCARNSWSSTTTNTPLVVRFLMRYGATLHDAEDAAQEAFTDAWDRVERTRTWAEVTDPRGWIRAVALRKYLRPPGSRRRPISVPVPEVPEAPTPGAGHAELLPGTLLVLDAMRSLDPEPRAVLAFHLDGFSAPAIGTQLGISDQKVRDLLKKARRILARTLTGSRDREEADR
jgi:RNA polymerase sigma factor (sigma-70 family)